MEKAGASHEQEARDPAPDRPAAESEKPEKPRRGRPPKSDKAERTGTEAEKEPKKSGPRKGRPSKADKAAPGEAKPSKRDKVVLLTKPAYHRKYDIMRKRAKRGMEMQLKLHMVTIEDLVPKGHFLRKLEATLDLSFIREETSHLYNHRYGRPAIDPVVLVKYLLAEYLYGIPSERQIEQRIQTDVALRWYLGLDLLDRVPDHSTISQLRRREPSFRKILSTPI